jgi:CRP-like cAMP-binding protein
MRLPASRLVVLQQTQGPNVRNLDASLLTTVPAFSRLTKAQIREALDQASTARFNEGDTVFGEGMEADRFFLLLDGHIRVIRTTPGGDQIIALHIAAGQMFGIAAALGRITYPATAIAASETLALSWPTRLWHDFAERYDGFSTSSMAMVGTRMEELHARVADMATQAVEQRVATALLRMVNQSGRKVEGGIEIAFPITRQNIADIAGTTLHTASRLLSAWQKDGIVESTRRHVVVTAPHRLMMLSEPRP